MRLAVVVGTILLAASRPTPVPQTSLELPDDLKPYRSWQAVSKEPFPVPDELWTLCVHPSREQEAKAAREHGPHVQLAVQVFTNPIASTVFYSDSPRSFPKGSIVVKEKLAGNGTPPVAVAAMIKGAAGSSPESGDWKFVYITSQGPVDATQYCQDCHRAAPTDSLFRSYPSARLK